MVGEPDLFLGGGARVAGLPGLEDGFVFHPLSVGLEILDLGLKLFLLSLEEAGFEFVEMGNHSLGLIVPDVLEERRDPGQRLGSAASIEFVGYGPEMFVGVVEI